jgi:hypothetical protein
MIFISIDRHFCPIPEMCRGVKMKVLELKR